MEESNGNELFRNNQALVTFALKPIFEKFPKWFVDFHHDDMVQCGLLGLYNASVKFDESKGYEFNTYAVKCIKGEVYQYLERELRSRRKTGKLETISIETPINDNLTLGDMLKYEMPECVDWIFTDKRLDDEQRKICRLLYEGRSQNEICKLMNVCQTTISRRIKKIRKILETEE